MTKIGLTNSAIVWVTIIFTVVMMISNIPFGLLADRWSRKGVIALGGLFLAASSLICGLSHDFITYVIGMAFWGLFYASVTGAYDSVIYDTVLEETGKDKEYARYFGKLQVYNGVALIGSSLLSGVIAEQTSLRADYFITAPLALFSCIALFYFKEPKLHKKETKTLIGTHINETFRAIFKSKNGRELLLIVTSLVFMGVGVSMLSEFGPLWLVTLSLPLVLYGPIIALTQSSIAISGIIARKIEEASMALAAMSGLVLLGSLALTRRYLIGVIAGEVAMFVGLMALTIVLNRRLHAAVPSNVRAGSSSLVSTLGYLLFLPIAGIFSLLNKYADIFSAAWVIIGVVGISFLGLLTIANQKSYRSRPVLR